MKKYLYFIVCLMTLSSCTKNEPIEYINDPAINFPEKEVNFSFFYSKESSDRVNAEITIHAMGYPSDKDRPFTLQQTNLNGVDAAIPGVHYLAFDSKEMKERMVMPAGKSDMKLPITLIKDPSLDLKIVKLTVKVAENENFKAGVIEMDSTNVFISSLALKPTNWSSWVDAFGPDWGSVKMRFIIDHTGITDFENVPTDYAYLLYLNSKLKQALYDYNEAHPNQHLAEADGTFVKF